MPKKRIRPLFPMPFRHAMRSEQWRIIGLMRPYWRSMLLALLLLTGTSLLSLALPWVMRWLVDSVFVTGDLAQLDRIARWLLGVSALQSSLSIGHRYLIARVGQRIMADLRLQVYTHIQRLPLGFFTTRRTGELVSRVSADVTVVQEALTDTPITLLRQSVTLVGGLTLMIIMNWHLTLLVLLLIPPIVIVSSLFGRRLQRISATVQDRVADATVTLEEMLSGIRVVKSFVREDYERTRFAAQVEQTYTTAMQRARVRSLFGPLVGLLGFGMVTLLLWYGGRQVVQGALTPGEMIAFVFYMMLVIGPLDDFAGLYGRLREAMGAGQRLFELLDTPPEPYTTPADTMPLPVLQGAVRFEQVGFSYELAATDAAPGAQHNNVIAPGEGTMTVVPVLSAINFDVVPGQTVALVGPSGAGKTTLVNLIPRFFTPTSGRILFDGYDAQQFDLATLRAQIGIVPQETFLFGGTVRENIAYGQLDADNAAIMAAAQAANAHDFIAALPAGYQTLVGEKGVRLSVGQRQRIAIARVLLKNPCILILDEATSALDNESERLVQEALERLMLGRTTFVIAHRLSTVQRADRILVLAGGRIVESGRHADLLAQEGLYAHLWSLQFAEIGAVGREAF